MDERHNWVLFQQEHPHWYERVEIPRVADPEPVLMGPQKFYEEEMLKAKGVRKALKKAVEDAAPPELEHPAPETSPKKKTFTFGHL